MAKSRNYDIKKASSKEDRIDHFDYHFKKEDKEIKVEVKAMKRISRADDNGQDEWIWVEFKNVQGNLGWLYGKADYVAFELQDCFLFVNREDLVKVSENVVDLSEIVKKPFEARRKGYHRRSRPDELVSMIHLSDITNEPNLRFRIWKKP